ncbi:MAG: Uma2 family endonuclease [Chloroflexi bacterium]|nr:Uma2 family endonuclease [Chloroflexota bacterium]
MAQAPTLASPAIPSTPLPEQGKWTYEDWLKLPENDYRYEIIDGVLHMAPPPNFEKHQKPAFELATQLKLFAKANKLGLVGVAPTGVRLPTQSVPLQPDIFFVAAGRNDVRFGHFVEGAPDLIVEVLSPSNWMYDRQEKFQAYQDAGVREYWIVDPRVQTIEVFVLEQGAFTLIGKWGATERAQSQVMRGFEINVAELFQE